MTKNNVNDLRKRIDVLERECARYTKRLELRKIEITTYHNFIDKLKLNGRVTIEELQKYFRSQKEIKDVKKKK